MKKNNSTKTVIIWALPSVGLHFRSQFGYSEAPWVAGSHVGKLVPNSKCSTRSLGMLSQGQVGQLAAPPLNIFQATHHFHDLWHGTVEFNYRNKPIDNIPSQVCAGIRKAFQQGSIQLEQPSPHGKSFTACRSGVQFASHLNQVQGFYTPSTCQRNLLVLKLPHLVFLKAHGNNHNSERDDSKSLQWQSTQRIPFRI